MLGYLCFAVIFYSSDTTLDYNLQLTSSSYFLNCIGTFFAVLVAKDIAQSVKLNLGTTVAQVEYNT